ncbi:non-heme iron oxygenase ferredoxin subunit [Aquibium sp. LZ166]|uniref:Non-heme iron oxygenase ferredoxin subunit n=1 Tax=Aquibium pacificus TaxID=3153579 RepID=A0ABV3SI41_9HYPH
MIGATSETLICALADIPDDEGLRVDLNGFPPLAVWRVGEQAYVTDDTCTHGQASLTADGMQNEFVIECGLHQGEFDIRDGSVRSPPCSKPLRVYATRVVDDQVYAVLQEEQG